MINGGSHRWNSSKNISNVNILKRGVLVMITDLHPGAIALVVMAICVSGRLDGPVKKTPLFFPPYRHVHRIPGTKNLRQMSRFLLFASPALLEVPNDVFPSNDDIAI
jgi:hypothetical protein